MKKRGIAALLVMLLVLNLVLSACGRQDDKNPGSEKSAAAAEKELFADQWETYLETTEDVYAKLFWAMDYAEVFVAEDSWDSLLKARAACTAAERYIRNLSAPSFTLTEAQCGVLTDAGVETDAVRNELMSLPEWIDQKADTMLAMTAMLEVDFFLEAEFSGMDEWLAHNRGALMDTAEYLCAMTNYILIQTEQGNRWERFSAQYPTLSLAQGPWSDDLKVLMSRGAAALDRYESRLTGMKEYEGLQNYSAKIIQEALDTGDLTYLEEEMHIVTGLSAYFPDPGWLGADAQRFYLVTQAQSGEKLPVEAGCELTEGISGCYISSGSIDQRLVEDYGERLKEWGFKTLSQWNDDGEFVVYAVYNDSSLLVEWNQEKTVVYLTEPVGCLIPELYLMALVIE